MSPNPKNGKALGKGRQDTLGAVKSATDVDKTVLEGILNRLSAPGGYQSFASQVKAARYCRRPVRLVGYVVETDAQGKRRVVFDTSSLPDGVLLKSCGTRRESLCPPCASIYRGDAYQLVAAGLRGGKGVPEVVDGHPAVFLTLTAPSFGVVHRQDAHGNCHLSGKRCPHGVALVCARRHPEDDEALGQALCAPCYDYQGAVLWNATVSELWRRTTIYLLRDLGHLAGMSARETARRLRLSYVKVVEFQQRASVHLHALVRVDVRGAELGPRPAGIDSQLLEAAVRVAVAKVSAPLAGSVSRRVSWGRQVDVGALDHDTDGRDRAVAYMAKYACKGSDRNGALDRRLPAGLPEAMPLPDHLRRMVEAAWELGGEAELGALRLRLWAHTCGFRGHFLTKSQRYSTTFERLRSERVAWEVARRRPEASAETEPKEGTIREWCFVGSGYLSAGDEVLAANLAEERRLGRRLAYEERCRQRAPSGTAKRERGAHV